MLRDVSGRSDAVWSFLLFTGYLKPVEVSPRSKASSGAQLAVPNAEVAVALRRAWCRTWLEAQVGRLRTSSRPCSKPSSAATPPWWSGTSPAW